MIVLGIDTSGSTASAAVLTDGDLRVCVSREARAHARVLPALMAEAASAAGAVLAEVTHVAVARGPGMFTGMRVGAASSQLFAYALGIPVAGVSTLRALALRVVQLHDPGAPFAVLVDARRREVFGQVFAPDGEPVDEPRAFGVANIRDEIPGAIPMGSVFVDDGLGAAGGLGAVPLSTAGLAAQVAQVAAQRLRLGIEPEPTQPLYLRRPDVTAAGPRRSVLGLP